jgi:hypothetical protein
MDGIIGVIALQHLLQPVMGRHFRPVWPGRQIAERQRIQHLLRWLGERRQSTDPALLRLSRCTRMEGDQRYHQLVKPLPTRKYCAVDRMKTRHPQRRRITDVMHPRCRYQALPSRHVKMSAERVGGRCDTTDVCESKWQSSKACLRCNSCLLHLRSSHDPTLRSWAVVEVSHDTLAPPDDIPDLVLPAVDAQTQTLVALRSFASTEADK